MTVCTRVFTDDVSYGHLLAGSTSLLSFSKSNLKTLTNVKVGVKAEPYQDINNIFIY